VQRLPGPRLGWWDGEAWWFVRIDRYFFDSEITVLSERLMPPAIGAAEINVGVQIGDESRQNSKTA
jgi:hypothetical protein